jgi:hypothetical protein
MRFVRVASSVLALSLAALALPGCTAFGGGRDKNAPLIAAANSPIADVPVPAGFVMTPDSTSKVVPGNQIRFVDHRYKGSDDVLPIVKFYRDTLPERGWQWVGQNQSRGTEMNLQFAKNQEDLTITITPGNFERTYIRIKIDPKGRDAGK